MASDLDTVTFICDQMREAGQVSSRKMFGEYTIYCDGKVVALVCDNQLFVKPTAAGLEVIGRPPDAPPYPGAKLHHLIEDLDDVEWLSRLVAATAADLPTPKPRKPRARKTER